MPDPSPLPGILAAVARKIRAEFDENSFIEHRGSKGTVREESLLYVLQRYLPGHVRCVGSSEIIASNGDRSGQCDIVIYDPKAPPLFGVTGYRMLPAECVYAVIEVKSKLTSEELRKSCDNIARIKKLPRTAYFPQALMPMRTQYGKQLPYSPTACFIFAYDSNDLRSMYEELLRTCASQPAEHRLDGAWVLGKGAYNWMQWPSQNILPMAEHGAWLAVSDVPVGQDILLNVVMILNTVMSLAFMPPFNLIKYAEHATLMSNIDTRRVDY